MSAVKRPKVQIKMEIISITLNPNDKENNPKFAFWFNITSSPKPSDQIELLFVGCGFSLSGHVTRPLPPVLEFFDRLAGGPHGSAEPATVDGALWGTEEE